MLELPFWGARSRGDYDPLFASSNMCSGGSTSPRCSLIHSLGVTFPNRLGGPEGESAQGTIKIPIKSDFSSDFKRNSFFCPFLAIIGEGVPSQRDIKLRPWSYPFCFCCFVYRINFSLTVVNACPAGVSAC